MPSLESLLFGVKRSIVPTDSNGIEQQGIIPDVVISESTTNTGPVNEHTTTSTASATTSTTGAHTHNVNVSD